MQTLGLTLVLTLSATTAFAAPAAAPVPASAPVTEAAATSGSGMRSAAVTTNSSAAVVSPAPAVATAAGATPPVAAGAAAALPATPARGGDDGQLPDPTRPPASVLAPVSASTEEAPLSGGLQSILLPKPRSAGKPRAIIHGQTVELGGRVGEARLVHLTETTAVLQGPEGREVLRLVPQDMVTLVRQPASQPRVSQRKPRGAASATAVATPAAPPGPMP